MFLLLQDKPWLKDATSVHNQDCLHSSRMLLVQQHSREVFGNLRSRCNHSLQCSQTNSTFVQWCVLLCDLLWKEEYWPGHWQLCLVCFLRYRLQKIMGISWKASPFCVISDFIVGVQYPTIACLLDSKGIKYHYDEAVFDLERFENPNEK